MRVPLMDLSRQYRDIRGEIDEALREVVESQQFIQGPAVGRFERNLAGYFGVAGAVGVASGSEALVVALLALDVGPGDEVVTTPHTFYATAAAVLRVGARPVFVDVEPRTMNLDCRLIERALTPRTRAILPVHIYGHPAAIPEILELARRRNLRVIEDCAQAIGATWEGRKVGTFGDVGCFSAYPAKNLGAFGDAGFLVTASRELAQRAAMIRDNGCRKKYDHEIFGYNARLDSIQAAVLDVKLRYIDGWNARRRELAARYDSGLSGLPLTVPPKPSREAEPVYHLYVVRTPERDRLAEFLLQHGVATQLYYPTPLHLQKCLAWLGYRAGDFPVAEEVAASNLALPLFPELEEAEQDHVISILRAFSASRGR